MLVGDNAVGKTALLRCIAVGLCDESSAAGLMKESEEGYIRRSEKAGKIIVELTDPLDPDAEYRITTKIERISVGSNGLAFERLHQKTDPQKKFPWNRIFACAYGMGRGTAGTGDIAGYSVINAVYNLFNYGDP